MSIYKLQAQDHVTATREPIQITSPPVHPVTFEILFTTASLTITVYIAPLIQHYRREVIELIENKYLRTQWAAVIT